eukprot:GILJ01007602.1.p1 GENE.GILJ01007602.1~~GILJ01007602.1.p1  ORF type:complete len:153 (+),score=18.53 GILJ01007602.1:48-506(+)
MLFGNILHPELLAALGSAGHSSKILIADGNYPTRSRLGKNAKLIWLNLSPGVLSATQILQAIVGAVPIELVEVMEYAREGPYALAADPPIWTEFRQILRDAKTTDHLTTVERFKFYESASDDHVVLAIASADQRIYANILLTVGVVLPASPQ